MSKSTNVSERQHRETINLESPEDLEKWEIEALEDPSVYDVIQYFRENVRSSSEPLNEEITTDTAYTASSTARALARQDYLERDRANSQTTWRTTEKFYQLADQDDKEITDILTPDRREDF